MAFPFILIAALFPVIALAANNWTEPCHAGECQWNLKSDHASGTMLLSGSNSSISDLTPAGGWTIIDCNATAADQEIRLVCHDPDKCNHLNLNGAENTVVRLPDDCSSEPFAVVSRIWKHTDQSIPASRRSVLQRRGGPQSSVQGITLSTDFAATNTSQHGNVTVFVVGSSMPGFDNLAQAVPGCNTTDAIMHPSQACNVSTVALSIFSGSGSKHGSFSLPATTLQTNLFKDSFSCPQSGAIPAFDGSISVDLKSTVTGSIKYAVTYKTHLFIPDPTSLKLAVGFDAALDGTLSLNADLTGTLSTGAIPLFTAGLPVLDFGSIFKLGPTFNIYAEADASLGTNLEMDVNLAYTISGGQLTVSPSSSPTSGGSFVPGKSNIKLSAGPHVSADAKLAAHLKPTFEFGLTIAGATPASVYLDLDAYAELDLSLTAGVTGSVSPGSKGSNSNSTSTHADVGGCVDISTGLSVDAGGKLFSLSTSITLFKKSFDLFKKCFGNGSGKRDFHDVAYGRRGHARALSPLGHNWRRRHHGHGSSRASAGRGGIVRKSNKGLSCPTSALGALSSIVSETVDVSR
ncbi:hypothetical protein GSI_09994 [Ganoderma sinense ZZ0214-1]|uniref:DUF7223 domain-containing protein n=1 Tax=Ganoderma sinense ZZ0214-1 TaxID=1077348 RepID=A0A2G8S289_9APHY|nr:hypothetical protein GSI_09994 [Ganoderma sinense ZZ0214-1]